MINRRGNPLLKFGWNAFALGTEVVTVIALRSLKLAAGGTQANAEAVLMVTEKLQAAWMLSGLAITGGLGLSAPRVVSKTLAHYRRKVRANRRRLSRSSKRI